jgi:glycosyltransferase involved in cell wall biosynthesis
MDVAIDGTPLLGVRTGVGRYVAGLLTGLGTIRGAPDVVVTAFTWRHAGALSAVAGGRPVRHRRMPARLLRQTWRRGMGPTVERLCGPVDVFHGTNFVLPPARRAAGVVTIHDLAFLHHGDTVDRTSRAYRDLVPRGLARAGAICVPTAAVRDQLMNAYPVDGDRVVVTPNGLSDAWLAGPRPPTAAWLTAHNLPERYVLFVGTLEPRKNLSALIDAMAQLAEAGQEMPLVVAGPAGWGSPARVTGGVVPITTGWLHDDALRSVVAGAACLVLPSLDEGFGLPPLEALACGIPVVVSDLPVFREVLGAHATYVPVGDRERLPEAIEMALADDGQAAAARRAHAGTYTWQRCAAATLHAYDLAREDA